MTDNVLLKNLVFYNFTAEFVQSDVYTRVSKKTGNEYMAPVVLLANVCLADTGQLVAKYYWLSYGKNLALLGDLPSGTQISFTAKPDIGTVGTRMNNDIASLIAWPRNFKVIGGSNFGKIPADRGLLVGYILTYKKGRDGDYDSLEEWYVDSYKEWEQDHKDELGIIIEESELEINPIQDSLNSKLDRYAAVKSEVLSKEKGIKYVIIDRETSEILDDNDNLGYTNIEEAYNRYERSLNSAEENYRKRRALSWLLNHADFDKKLLETYVEITDKGQWEGYISFDKNLVEDLLLQENHTHLEFTSKDLLEVWYKG